MASISDPAHIESDLGRKLVVCCDGTWNEPYQVGAPTNVVKMIRAIRPIDDNGVAQLAYYHPGVGTANFIDRFMGGTLGLGLSNNVQSAYDFLATNFVDGDKIFLFGFSRGAFTARSLAGLIGLVGLLEKGDMDLFPYLYDIYRSVDHRKALASGSEADIHEALHALFSKEQLRDHFERLTQAILNARPTLIFFIGVWDTVGAMGIPFGPLRWIGRSRYNFHDTALSERIRFAYQALAIDETRKAFVPALWTRPKGRGTEDNARKQTLEQVWFAGSHSNVGGGYMDCGLSDIAFLWMVEKAAAASWSEDGNRPLAFDERYLKGKIDQTMGLLVNSRTRGWKLMPSYHRSVLATPPSGKETCEFIHYSARFRFECGDKDLFSPFPYHPDNLKTVLGKRGSAIADLSELERTYRHWPGWPPDTPTTEVKKRHQ
jgi:uncharacterized protein (DUF2235 family)